MVFMTAAHESKFSIPSETSRTLKIQEEVVAHLTARGFTERDVFCVRLALEEGLVNAIKHGNQSDANRQVHFEYCVTDELITICIEDEGDGFRPELVPDPTLDENLDRPNGRGIMLMNSFMTSVEYEKGGRRLILTRSRSATTSE